MTYLAYAFYLLAVVAILWELLKLGGLNLSSILSDLNDKKKIEDESNEELLKANPLAEPKTEASVALGCFSLFALFLIALPYTVWGIVGLLSSQWVFFVMLFGLSFTHMAVAAIFKGNKPALNIIGRIDAFLTIILLVSMLINKFHLHWI